MRVFYAAVRLLRIWSAVAVVALAIHLGGFPLLDPDEGRNAEVGREMALTNDYVMPRLDGLPYLDKPIVYFAAEAAAMEVLGPTETAARLPALLFTIATAAAAWWFARRLWGEAEAWLAFIATLASPLSVAFSRTVIFDSALAFFITVAMMGFYLAVEEGGRPAPSIIAWIAIGLGVITKGPVAIALPLLVAIPYAIARKRTGAIFPLLGIVLFLAVIAPWVALISKQIPDFLNYVLVVETTQRLTTGALKRTGPPWYFIPYLLGGALPWTFVLFGQKLDRRDRGVAYLLLWIAIPFLFFSLSQSKRPQYILPLVPAVALLVARVWCEARRGTRIAAAVLILFGGACIAALRYAHLRDEFAAGATATAISFGVCAIAGGVIAFAFTNRRWISFIALSLPILATPLCANPLLNALASRRSTKALMARIPANAEVVGVEAFTGSMAFYLRRPIIVITPDAAEFTSNYLIRHYDKFAGSPTLQRPSFLDAALADRSVPRVFIVREGDAANRAKLAARARLLAEGAHYDAYTMPGGQGTGDRAQEERQPVTRPLSPVP
ncbi:MAG TPA: glycosyltransferase family 39 protein [Thermoanaerobaculia bacterium]|nr:glycosyltransferase family 39 protein [Thermoanaerobaculia bacterium]